MAQISQIVSPVWVQQVVFRHRGCCYQWYGSITLRAGRGTPRSSWGLLGQKFLVEGTTWMPAVGPKHVCGLSVTFLQKSGSKQERPTLENETGSGYKTLPMLFLWVSLKTSSCCKTWPFLVLSAEKEDPEEDPCDGWPFRDLPFYQGLLVGVPCDVSPLNIESKIITCTACSCICSLRRLVAFDFVVKA